PSRIESLRAGVSSLPPFVTSMRFMPPSSSLYLFSSASVNSTCWHPLAAASFVGTSEDAWLPPHLAKPVAPAPARLSVGDSQMLRGLRPPGKYDPDGEAMT